jgi:hypothetical protein
MTYRILQGDCIQVMRELPEASVDAVVCDPPTGYWLAGLIDGEGCFRIQRNRARRDKAHATYATTFTLKMRDDDEPILREIIALTGIGRYACDTKGRGGSRPCGIWVVDTRDGCVELALLLERYPLRTRKARDFLIWREAVLEWTNGERGNRWHGPRDWSRMVTLMNELATVRDYQERG